LTYAIRPLSRLSVTLVYCGQTVGWIKMPLGTEIGLSLGDVLDGDPAAPNGKGHSSPPLFGPCLSWPNGSINQDTTWYGGRPRPRRHCARWGPSCPKGKGAQQPPTFRPMSIVAKRSPITATAELLFFNCVNHGVIYTFKSQI